MHFGRLQWGPAEEARYHHWRNSIPYTNDQIADAYVRLAKRAAPLVARACLARAAQLRRGRNLSKNDLKTVRATLGSHDKFSQPGSRQARQLSPQDKADYIKVAGRIPSQIR